LNIRDSERLWAYGLADNGQTKAVCYEQEIELFMTLTAGNIDKFNNAA
jgi:hypothetical protein